MATNRDRSTRRASRVRNVVVGTAVAGSLGLATVLGLHVATTSSTDNGATSSTSTSSGTSSTSSGSSDNSSLVGSGNSTSSSATTSGS